MLQVEEQAPPKSRCIVHKQLSKTILRSIKEKVLVRTYGEIPAKKVGFRLKPASFLLFQTLITPQPAINLNQTQNQKYNLLQTVLEEEVVGLDFLLLI
jgi:hypothetical protein